MPAQSHQKQAGLTNSRSSRLPTSPMSPKGPLSGASRGWTRRVERSGMRQESLVMQSCLKRWKRHRHSSGGILCLPPVWYVLEPKSVQAFIRM